MRSFKGLSCVSAMSICAFMAATAPVYAQSSGGTTYLQTVTITSTRTEQTIQESPRSTYVATREELDKKAPESVAEMLRDVPGIEVVDANVAGMKRLRIRGESSRRVTVLIDGQEITDHSTYGTPILINPDIIDHIDIIRGPSSVLYGTKSIGGVINIITKRGGPNKIGAETTNAYFSGSDGYHGSASVLGTIGAFDYRVSGSISDHGDRDVAGTSFDPTGKLQGSSFSDDSLSAHLGFRFGENKNHYLQLKADRFRLDAEVWTDPADLGLQPSGSITDVFKIDLPQRDREKFAIFYDADNLGPVLKKVHVDAFYQTIDRIFTNDVGVLPNTGAGPFVPGPVDIDVGIRSDDTITNKGVTGQIDLKPLSNHYVIAGVQYLSDELDKDLGTNSTLSGFFPAGPPPWTLSTILSSSLETDLAETQTLSFFAQDEVKLGEGLKLTTGLRYYDVTTDLNASNHTALTSSHDTALLFSVGLTAEVNPTTTARVLYSQGYVYPTLLQLYVPSSAGGEDVFSNSNLEAETSTNLEVGARHDGKSWVVDLAAFLTNADDYLRTVNCTSVTTCPAGFAADDNIWSNIDHAQTYGVEFLAQYSIPDTQLRAYVNGAWMKRELDYSTFTTFNSNTPEWSGRIGLVKDWTWKGRANGYADLFVRAGTGAELTESDGEYTKTSGWGTLNLALGVAAGEDDKYRLSVNFNNITDESYRATVDELPGVGRSVGITAKIKFN